MTIVNLGRFNNNTFGLHLVCIICDERKEGDQFKTCGHCRGLIGREVVRGIQKTVGKERDAWIAHARSIVKGNEHDTGR